MGSDPVKLLEDALQRQGMNAEVHLITRHFIALCSPSSPVRHGA